MVAGLASPLGAAPQEPGRNVLLCSKEKPGEAGAQEMVMVAPETRMNSVGAPVVEGTISPGQKPPSSL